MGCWYETCALSGLPIPPKTPCLLFLLAPGNHLDDGRSGYSYPSGLWQPRCLPVTGVYNDDCGTLDLDETPPAHWAYTERMLDADHLAWTEDGAPGRVRFEIAARYTPAFFNKVERGLVFGRNLSFGHRHRDTDYHYPIGQTLVRKDVWDHLLGVEHLVDWGGTTREGNRKAAEEFVDFNLGLNDETVAGLAKRILTVKASPPRWDLFAIEAHFRDRREHRTPFHWLVFDHGGGELPAGCGIYRTHLTADLLEKKVDRETALSIFHNLADLAHVGRLMSLLRRAWRPQAGKGSQDIEWDLHRDLAVKVAAIAAEQQRRDDEDSA